ncbi:MAG: benzoyl-CoA 2,3-epoxidase subunit BoxB, partial [Candidatus Binataceae bacterium]
NYFAVGLKGRFQEEDEPDHLALEQIYELKKPDGSQEQIPMRRAMNAVLRDSFSADCFRGLRRWNRELERRNIDTPLYLPTTSFNRKVGAFAGLPCDPHGKLLSPDEFERRRGEWLPAESDRAMLRELMKPVYEQRKIASWIAPPAKGIDGKPALEFEYVRFN